MQISKEDRSLNDLFSDLTHDSSELMRKELELAKAEIAEKITQLRGGLIALGVGAAILIAGLFYILDAIVYGLGEMLPASLSPWLAALIVGVVVSVIGYMLIKKGEDALELIKLAPRKTVESLRKDKNLLKEQQL